MDTVRFYKSGDIVRDLGIIYLNKIIQKIEEKSNTDLNARLSGNYFEFDLIDPDVLSNYVLNNEIFSVFKKNKYPDLQKIFEEEVAELSNDNYLQMVKEKKLSKKDEQNLIKAYEGRRFPYIRNSGKYGGNTSLEKMTENFKRLTYVVVHSNKHIKQNDNVLAEFEMDQESQCSICHINQVPAKDINLETRVNSKYNYLFQGSIYNTFNNYGNVKNTICFECEFLNLLCLLYLSLEKPNTLAYVNDLKNLEYVNYKLMLERRSHTDKSFYQKLGHERYENVKLYDFKVDAKKGIIIKMNSIVEYDELLGTIELLSIVDDFNFHKDSAENKNLGRLLVKNRNYDGLRNFLLSNVAYMDSDGGKRGLNIYNTRSNVSQYIKCIDALRNKEEFALNEDYGRTAAFKRMGKNLANKMGDERSSDAKKRGLVFKLLQFLKANDRERILQIIMHTLTAYSVPLEKGMTDGIMKCNERELHKNIGTFIEELMGGKKNE